MILKTLFASLLVLALPMADADLVLESGPTQTGLLELYTSEGCNSCPPADRWLSTLTEEATLWRDFVPVAFHVDYWDYIGWKDRFAAPQHTQRQRAHAAGHGLSTIYTPGFVLNGEEWRDWRSRQAVGAPSTTRAGKLSVTIADGHAQIVYAPRDETLTAPQVYLAVLGFGLTSQVRAGENAGRKLSHDFVVLTLENTRLNLTAGRYAGTLRLQPQQVAAPRYGIAAWVSANGKPTPLQAVGGWLAKL